MKTETNLVSNKQTNLIQGDANLKGNSSPIKFMDGGDFEEQKMALNLWIKYLERFDFD